MEEGDIDYKNIYQLALHEVYRIDREQVRIEIMRVPMGWLYTYSSMVLNNNANTVFVPYSKEFKK